MLRQFFLDLPGQPDPEVIREDPLAEFGHIFGIAVREGHLEASRAGGDLGGCGGLEILEDEIEAIEVAHREAPGRLSSPLRSC